MSAREAWLPSDSMNASMSTVGALDAPWENSLVFVYSLAVFALVYAFGFLVLFRHWKGRARYEAASCCISFLHGTLSAILAGRDLWLNEWILHGPNTEVQNKIMEYSMAYFVVDLLNYFYAAPDDYLFIGHHIATLTYMLSSRYFVGCGATSVMCLIAAGEATSPVQNVWTLARMSREEYPLSKKIYTTLSPWFTVYFTLIRGILGPYLVWELGKFYLTGQADSAIPRWLAYCWMLKITFAISGSMVWVYKLWLGLIRFYAKEGGLLGRRKAKTT
eukprot:TRINITY_DN4932_c0_g1_i1.p1 TRINITY_DN4932_c0_g1~~TRINITY_DN4932_c0_g1_i1.p1  ORF type:complete len:275 (-),score=12.07 TRINITY_DN4932_c0_g1_i1:581-1405(-)